MQDNTMSENEFSQLQESAAKGCKNAQYHLGVMYQQGEGDIAQDASAAATWFTKAAEQGHAEAQYHLGVMHLNGEGDIAQDASAAAKWFTKAAEQGHTKAQYHLGLMHLNGEGGAKSNEIAFHWIQLAAEQGYAEAQYHLGVMHLNGEGVAKNDEMALDYLKSSAAQMHAGAQLLLGDMYTSHSDILSKHGCEERLLPRAESFNQESDLLFSRLTDEKFSDFFYAKHSTTYLDKSFDEEGQEPSKRRGCLVM